MKKSPDSSKSNDSKIAIAFAVAGSFVSIVLVLAKLFHIDTDHIDSIFAPLIFGLCINILSYLYRIWLRLGDIYKTDGDIFKNIKDISGSSIAQSKEYQVISSVMDYAPVPKQATEKLLAHYYDSITASSSEISIDTRDLSIYFNTKLWEELTEFQKSSSEQIEINITHSVSIEFWERDDAVSSLENQAKFVDAGGKIVRIIQGPFSYSDIEKKDSAQNKEVEKYHKIMKKMSSYNIEVFYVKKTMYSWPYDFLWARFGEASKHPDLAMLWYADHSVISKCTLIIDTEESDEMRDVKIKWDSLIRKIDKDIE